MTPIGGSGSMDATTNEFMQIAFDMSQLLIQMRTELRYCGRLHPHTELNVSELCDRFEAALKNAAITISEKGET